MPATEPRRPPGRPSALTRKRADRLVALLASGETVTSAAAQIGVSRRTVQRWRRRAWSREAHDRAFVELEQRVHAALVRRGQAEPELEDVRELMQRLEEQWPARWALADDAPEDDA